MKFDSGIFFGCTDCDKKVNVHGAGSSDGRIYLVGICPQCKATVLVDIEKVIVELTAMDKRRSN